jgi:Zn-dependent protease with chaperone function
MTRKDKKMNAHEKLDLAISRVRPVFYSNGLGEIFDSLEIWLIDNHNNIASIRGKRIEIRTYSAYIMTDGGLSFIIGHETYHFLKHLKRQNPAYIDHLLTAIDSNKTSLGKILIAITGIAVSIPLSKFESRREEYEADQFGKKITIEAGLPLSDIKHFFEKEVRNSQGGGFLDTHPHPNERERRLGL